MWLSSGLGLGETMVLGLDYKGYRTHQSASLHLHGIATL